MAAQDSATSGRLLRASEITGLILTALVVAAHLAISCAGWATDCTQDVAWRNYWWDTLHRQFPRDRKPVAEAPAVVVAIDEETLSGHFPWPWPRNKTAALVDRIRASGAITLGADLILSQRDPFSPKLMSKYFRDQGVDEIAEPMGRLGGSDIVFRKAMHDLPTVLPVAGAHVAGDQIDASCEFQAPVVVLDPEDMDLPGNINGADPPLPIYQEAALGFAAIDVETGTDFVIRSVDAVQQICGKPMILLGPETLRIAEEGFFSTVREIRFGREVVLGDIGSETASRFPTERDGTFWMHFGPVLEDRYIAAKDLLDTPDPDPRLAGKIVFLAVVDLGRIDQYKSPLGQTIFGIEVHLQMVEQIVDGAFLRRPQLLFWLELAIIVAGCLLVVKLVPVPRAKPAKSVILIIVGLAGLGAVGAVAFDSGFLLDAATPVGGIGLVAVGVLSATLIERDRARLKFEIDLQTSRADQAQLQGELDAAARIQTALLPPRQFSAEDLVDLACFIRPARTVGGDFYDHFMIDDQHLFFLVADVSGKGADASQFMLLSKTLWKSVALRTGIDLDSIQLKANSEITRENAEMMFVTGLCGIYNLETCELTYSSAGHDTPFIFGDERAPEQLAVFSGPPAGLMDGVEFPVGQITLKPGDRLCIFTDGVTEAINAQGELFGVDRLTEALKVAEPGLTSADLVDHIVGSVEAFSTGFEQSDDITLMIVSIPDIWGG